VRYIAYRAADDPYIMMAISACTGGSGQLLVSRAGKHLWKYPHVAKHGDLISLAHAMLRDEIIYDGPELPSPTSLMEGNNNR